MNTKEIMELESKYQLQTYKKFPIVVVKGKDCYVFDSDGKKYLDFYGGHAVVLTGHCHPRIVEAIKGQSEKLIFYSNSVYNEMRAEAARAIIEIAPKGLTKVFFCNSGAESNEAALKMARKFTGKEEIISFYGAFHGRTIATLSACGIEKYRIFKPLLSGYKFANFGDIESVKNLITQDTAGIILEPIQSMAGIRVAKKEFYTELRKLCDEEGLVLIFDEAQTFCRIGKFFAGENWDVTPDIIATAKGIASGVPMGATLISEKIADTIKIGEHGSTFAGGPIASAACKATIEVVKREKLVENAKNMEEYIKNKFEGFPVKVRGIGLLLGLEFDKPAKEIQNKALEKGLIVGSSEDARVLRLMPPLIIEKEHVDEMVKIFEEIL